HNVITSHPFHSPPAHRTLHSFPTRRSSDLCRPASVSVRRAHHRHRQRNDRGRKCDPYRRAAGDGAAPRPRRRGGVRGTIALDGVDRKSTRLNSSHVAISYAVFCLKKKKEGE